MSFQNGIVLFENRIVKKLTKSFNYVKKRSNGMINYDLIIVGGGTAGALCAIAAARNGVKVAVVEKSASLGGMSTCSGLTEMNAAGFQGAPLYKGIEEEIFNELISCGCGEYHFKVAMSSNKDVKVDRLRYDPERLKLILEDKAVQAGVKLYYEASVESVNKVGESYEVNVSTIYEKFTLSATYLADGTGNADLVRLLGGETIKTEKEKQLTSTLMFRLSNVDVKALQEYLASGQLPQLIKKGFDSGVLKGKILAFTPIPGSNDVSLNVTRASGDYEDCVSYSQAIIETRKQILPILAFIKENIPAVSNCYISNIAPFLGVRDGRRIVGQYCLTIDDLDQMVEFDDAIACGCYPMDIHDPITKSVVWKVLPGVYYIPYRSLLPKGISNTLAIGKCLSADKKAFGAIRVMPIMMNVGESAGYLFAYALKNNKQMNELENDEIKKCLDQHYN